MKETRLIISLGSNTNQEDNIRKASEMIMSVFGQETICTKAIWTSPIGIESDRFLNRLALAYTSLELEQVNSILKDIELKLGGTSEDKRQGVVRIDIDIMLYGNKKLHIDDWQRAYVLKLMTELESR